MPHAGKAPGGGAKGPGLAKKGQGGACHAPTKPVESVPADSDPIVITNSSPDVMCPELFEACRAGRVERVRRLLAHDGVSAQATDFYGKTCFHSACLAGQVEVLEALLELCPALLQQSTDDGKTALMFACEFGQGRSARFLLERGVDPCASAADGSTALMRASERGSAECVELLLGGGCDIDARNTEGFTALLYAAQKGRTAVAKALLDAGADPSARLAVGTSAHELALADGHDATAKALEIHAKLQARKAARLGGAPASAPSAHVDDGRSLDDLVADLEGGSPAAPSTKSKKKKKSKGKAEAEEAAAGEPSPVLDEAAVADTCEAKVERPADEAEPASSEADPSDGSGAVALKLTCRALDRASAAKVDAALRDAARSVRARVAGVAGVERAVCKTTWDYIVTVNFEHRAALDACIAAGIMERDLHPLAQQLGHLCVGGASGVRWQTFAIEHLL